MKILYISNNLLNRLISSGGDHIFIEVSRRWAEWGEDLSIMIPQVAVQDCASRIPKANIQFIQPSSIDRENIYLKYFFMTFPVYILRTITARKLIRNIDVEQIVTNGDFFCNTIPASLKKRLNPKSKWTAYIYHVNASPLVRKGNSFLMSCISYLMQRFSFRLIKKHADLVILLNEEVKKQLIDLGFDSRRLAVLGGGINYQEINLLPSDELEKYDACWLGRIYPTKGIMDLPEIWKKVVEVFPESKLAIIGSGPESWVAELKKRITALNIDKNVIIKGYLPAEQAYGLIKSSKIFVSASYEEGWGISVCEGMACGIPVVAYDLASYREAFPEGLCLVPLGDKERFAQSIIQLLADKEKRIQTGKQGKTIAAQYDWEKVAGKYLNIMKKL